ncbi:MAG: hypothetical protein C0615_02445 [Desulfuromonas sp.]|nr:MAG: hypothetical protein C0615_02445 [Desulfuromonas sp.]
MKRFVKKVFCDTSSQGFTLVELLVIIALVGIIALISAPNFQTMSVHSNHNKDARFLLGVLQQARMEAVRKNEFVSVRFSNDATVRPHIVLFYDENHDRTQDAGEDTFLSLDFDYVDHDAGFTGGTPVAIFNSRGLPSSSRNSANFIVVSIHLTNNFDDYEKWVVVSRSGKIRVQSEDPSP